MKRLIILILSVSLLCGMLAACGGNTADSTPATEAPISGETDPPATESPTSEENGVFAEAALTELKQEFDDILTGRLFEGAAYIVYQGQEIYSAGTGWAIKADQIPNGIDVVYQIASNTKQFTAAAILKLSGEGKLSLNDTLDKYYPAFEAGRDITLHSMLSMQSGIPDYLRFYDEDGNEVNSTSEQYIPGISQNSTAEQNRALIMEHIFSMEPLFPQGDRFSYSNSNYLLLGGIIEQVTGMSYQEYLKMTFFDPLGMDTADFIGSYDRTDVVAAKGYRGGGGWFTAPGAAFACGDIIASPIDLYKWETALHGGRVLSDDLYQKMITPYITDTQSGVSYGYGLMIQKNIGATLCYHSGSIPGFTSMVCCIPEQDYFIALISNHSNENTGSITMLFTQMLTEHLSHKTKN